MSHGFLFKLVPWFIGIIFIGIITFWIFVGIVAVDTYEVVKEYGLKSVVHDIWDGQGK